MVYPKSPVFFGVAARHISHPIDPFSDRVEPLELVAAEKFANRIMFKSPRQSLIKCGKRMVT